jgi:hypothetical protein
MSIASQRRVVILLVLLWALVPLDGRAQSAFAGPDHVHETHYGAAHLDSGTAGDIGDSCHTNNQSDCCFGGICDPASTCSTTLCAPAVAAIPSMSLCSDITNGCPGLSMSAQGPAHRLPSLPFRPPRG